MRSKYRAVCAALVGALAVMALSAGSAFASAPEFVGLEHTGETFSGHVSSAFWEYSNDWSWNDTEATISGEIVNSGVHANKAIKNVTLTFKGGNNLASCDNGAPGAYELVLTGLEGYLGYLNESTKLIGLAIFKPGGETFAMKLEQILAPCVSNLLGNANFEGVFAIPLSEAKTTSNTHKLLFKDVTAGKMQYNTSTFRWEGGKNPFVNINFPLKLRSREGTKEVLDTVGITTEIPFTTKYEFSVSG